MSGNTKDNVDSCVNSFSSKNDNVIMNALLVNHLVFFLGKGNWIFFALLSKDLIRVHYFLIFFIFLPHNFSFIIFSYFLYIYSNLYYSFSSFFSSFLLLLKNTSHA